MIYYTRGSIVFHFGKDYELNHRENYKLRILQPGDILINVHKVRVVLGPRFEENFELCNVLENGQIGFVSKELNLYSVSCS